jgi:hypothetical protein
MFKAFQGAVQKTFDAFSGDSNEAEPVVTERRSDTSLLTNPAGFVMEQVTDHETQPRTVANHDVADPGSVLEAAQALMAETGEGPVAHVSLGTLVAAEEPGGNVIAFRSSAEVNAEADAYGIPVLAARQHAVLHGVQQELGRVA